MRPRVGHIQFLNCLPLYHMLVRSGAVLDMDLYKDTAIALCRRLLSGKLDISPVPAIEYARHAGDLLLLPNLTVSSNGQVMSILLVSKVPAEKLQGRPVALTNTSATSQVLTKIVLREKFNVDPVYFECPPDLPEMFREADAALLIGDPALQADAQAPHLLDLGEAWDRLTGLPFVFAVWAAPRGVELGAVPEALRDALEAGRAALGELAADGAARLGLPLAVCDEYLRRAIHYDLDDDALEGLREFGKMAARHGIIERYLEPKLYGGA